jgi:LDH2 family malate/lactate/ureidoglycolate dehydrogenase
MPTNTTERVHLTVGDARTLSEQAMRGIGYEPEEARILADHVIDAALCGYEYSGLPKLLSVADHPRFKARRSPMRALKETSVSVLFDGCNQSGILGMYHATRAVIWPRPRWSPRWAGPRRPSAPIRSPSAFRWTAILW